MILLRKEHHVFGRGSIRFVAGEPQNLRLRPRVRGRRDALRLQPLAFAQPVELDLAEFEGLTPVEMLGKSRFPGSASCLPAPLSPFGFYWFQLTEDDSDD